MSAPAGWPDQATFLISQLAGLRTQFAQSDGVDDLDALIDAANAAMAVTPTGHPGRGQVLSTLAHFSHVRYERTGDTADLDASVAFSVQTGLHSVAGLPVDHPDRIAVLASLENLIRLDAESKSTAVMDACLRVETDGLAGVDAALTAAVTAMTALPVDHPGRTILLAGLAPGMRARYLYAGDFADLNVAVEAANTAIALLPVDSPSYAGTATELHNALLLRSQVTGDAEDLGRALNAAWKALEVTPDDESGALWLSISSTLAMRSRSTGDLTDLNYAVDAGLQAFAKTPEDEPGYGATLAGLAGILVLRFQQTGDQDDLRRAVAAGEHAAAVTQESDPDWPIVLMSLAETLRFQFRETGTEDVLDRAVEIGWQALRAIPRNHPGWPLLLAGQASVLTSRGVRADDVGDLDSAVDLAREGSAALPPGHASQPEVLLALAEALHYRFRRVGDAADIDDAVAAAGGAATAAPATHAEYATVQASLGEMLMTRFQWTGSVADLERAVDAVRRAAETLPANHHARAQVSSNLNLVLGMRFARFGNLADLDAAVDAGYTAVAATEPDHPQRPFWLANLANALLSRFRQVNSLSDLDAAIAASDQSLASLPAEHPSRVLVLVNLTQALVSRYERTAQAVDIDAAIDAGRAALVGIPDDHPERPKVLAALSAALTTRFHESADAADLVAAAETARTAVAALPKDHPDRIVALTNLGVALTARFEHDRNMTSLDEAILVDRQVIAAVPADHPNRATALFNLGSNLELRFAETGNQADLDAAIDAHREAAGMATASAIIRLSAAVAWGLAAANRNRWSDAAAGFGAGVELTARVAARGLDRSDQEFLLGELGGLASEAAGCCLRAGLVTRAFELLDQGRGVLLGQALDTRTDLTALQERHPDLASQFVALRDEIDRADPATLAGSMSADGSSLMDGAEMARWSLALRREAAAGFERIVDEVRSMPGFGTFLRPLTVSELAVAAEQGPVVAVTVSQFGAHALILTADGKIDALPLEGLTQEEVRERVLRIVDTAAGSSAPLGEDLSDTLDWLWDVIAGPVLERLGITDPPQDGEPWPRVWWCLSGLLSFLPVHAAGRHATQHGPSSEAVIDRAVSSYTPTVRVLAETRRAGRTSRASAARLDEGEALVVAMPETPGASSLPGTGAEADLVGQHFRGRLRVLVGARATRDAVLTALTSARWAHFACHGHTDIADPSASRLLLADHETRPLTVVDLARLRLAAPELAFLSACSTARPGDRLADEAIHLASACQLAGYRHVIATLWPIADTPVVADEIYEAIAMTSDIGAAVHTVTRRMRDSLRDRPSAWAAHIHTGA
ncbi:CHAT domain-containing protein [Pseudofrankia saprophytica]|uniref:CHAT domain-containing protein n=1 Tax=Pseudofrankia saprophytica TaxID=298655 RepID=UPI000234BF47|nr:CHAT domain-containing protein [Pseudofrankia saprophytica]